jgi:hypothetical protein
MISKRGARRIQQHLEDRLDTVGPGLALSDQAWAANAQGPTLFVSIERRDHLMIGNGTTPGSPRLWAGLACLAGHLASPPWASLEGMPRSGCYLLPRPATPTTCFTSLAVYRLNLAAIDLARPRYAAYKKGLCLCQQSVSTGVLSVATPAATPWRTGEVGLGRW